MTKRVLTWVNTQRAKLGGEPLAEIPKGRRLECSLCPIANAFRDVIPEGADTVGVDGDIIQFGRAEDFDAEMAPMFHEPVLTIKCPKYVQNAIANFDSCRLYRHLALEPA